MKEWQSDSPKLQLVDLSFSWKPNTPKLFGSLDKCFKSGTIAAILGPNGVGKTTLFNIIANRLPSSSGHVLLNDSPMRKTDFNFMIQDPSRLLFSHLTLAENIALVKRDLEIQDFKCIKQLIFPKEDVLGRYPSQASGGQRQRAVLYRTLSDVPNFPVTLLDEPFSQLSQDIKLPLYEQIRCIIRGSMQIILLITHDISEALLLSDEVLVLTSHQISSFDTSQILNPTDLSSNNIWEQVQMTLLGDYYSTRL